jgi:hypothetical protein
MVQKSKCGEKGIADLLPWYVSKSLSEAEMIMVENHLSVCTSCKEELNSINWIVEGLNVTAGETGLEHINSKLLTIFSESKKELKKEVIARIENHLSSCQQCSKELEILNKVNDSLNESETVPIIRSIMQKIRELFTKPVLKPVYAYILLLALLYPAWLGLFTRDSSQGKISEPVNIGNIFVLEQNDQRAAGKQLNTIVLDKKSSLIVFSFVLPIKKEENNIYLTSISNSENKVIWKDNNLKFIDQSGTVILVCPQIYFIEGKYTLTVIEKQKQTNRILNKYLFNFSLLNKD